MYTIVSFVQDVWLVAFRHILVEVDDGEEHEKYEFNDKR